MPPKLIFSCVDDEKLVERIAHHPLLYCAQNSQYKDYEAKENVWREIAQQLNKSAADCKKRWKNIRDTYLKHKRANKCGTGSAARPKSRWALLDHLNFLEDVPCERNTFSNMGPTIPTENTCLEEEPEEGPAEEELEEPMEGGRSGSIMESNDMSTSQTRRGEAECGTVARKRRRSENSELLEMLAQSSRQREEILISMERSIMDDTNPVYGFFKSMAQIVATFPPQLAAETKAAVFKVVHESELKAINKDL